VTISATFGATVSEAQRMAAGLIVHPGEPGLPSAQDEILVRRAFAHAYTGGTPDAIVLAAIENGQSLAPVLADFKRQQPQMASAVRLVVDRVQFSDASHANVTYSLTFGHSGSTGIGGSQGAVKVDGQWKVTQRGFCTMIQTTGIACPAR
jgi:hypothetical protein